MIENFALYKRKEVLQKGAVIVSYYCFSVESAFAFQLPPTTPSPSPFGTAFG